MEKLQAALEKARSRRSVDAGGTPPKMTSPRHASADKASGLWQNLKEIELSGKVLQNHHVVSQSASQTATPFDILRTKVLFQMQQNGWKSLAITSPMPKSGKTTMACNLALGLGRQGGLRTLLFDLDLQNPSVGEFLGHTPEADISDMLSGNVSFAEQAVRVGEAVGVSMANRHESDPTRTLLSSKTEKTIESIRATYEPDIMIFDMPSILDGDNTRAFLKNVDCALVVVRANSTRFGHFDVCEREVAEYTNVLGVVLNAFRAKGVQSHIE